MANEVLVANLQPLKPGEEDLAFSCALPISAKGIRVLSRKSYEASAVSIFDNPLSSRFDENDALIYFDDVKVPWDRIFVYRDTDVCRATVSRNPGPCLPELSGADPPVGEDQVPGRAGAPPDRGDRHHQNSARCSEKLGYLAAQASMVEAMLSGMEAERLQIAANTGCRTSTSCIPRRC